MTYNEILYQIKKEINNINIQKDINFYCYISNNDISKEIYAIVEKFDGDVTEFTVCFMDPVNNSRQYTTYDSVSKFIKDFKDIEEAVKKVRKIANSVVFF